MKQLKLFERATRAPRAARKVNLAPPSLLNVCPLNMTDKPSNTLDDELEAICSITRILDNLGDREKGMRVLDYCNRVLHSQYRFAGGFAVASIAQEGITPV